MGFFKEHSTIFSENRLPDHVKGRPLFLFTYEQAGGVLSERSIKEGACENQIQFSDTGSVR